MWDGLALIETVRTRFLNHSLTILWLFIFWGQSICYGFAALSFDLVYFDEVAKKKKNTNMKNKNQSFQNV